MSTKMQGVVGQESGWQQLGSSWDAVSSIPTVSNWGRTKVYPHLASLVNTSLYHSRSLGGTAVSFSQNDRLRWSN